MGRENEFEDPGANYPDEGGSTTAAPPSPSATDPAVASADEQVAPEQEPSHHAVGIGVQDSGQGVHDAGAGDDGGGGAGTSAEADASTDHHGQDGARDTLTVGEAQRTSGALGSEQEQRLPAMSQNNASDVEKVTGIVAQTRGDIGTHPVEEIERVLAQRFEQSGVELPADEVAELARQISTGDASSPE